MELKGLSHEEEFKFIMKHYLAPLVGVKLIDMHPTQLPNEKNSLLTIKDQSLIFYEDKKSSNCYKISVSKNFPEHCMSLLNTVYEGLNEIRYKTISNEIKNKYQDFEHLVKNYEYIVQKKVIHWLCGNKPYTGVLKLIDILEQWNTKTYEGRKVPFAFTIDLNSDEGKFSFDDFLHEEYSATFSDGITSIIHLDKNLKYIDYDSITSSKNLTNDHSNTPYRFGQVIKSFTKKKIGIYLLTSGDIILIKNCVIELVKREGKWLNFNKDIFSQIILGNIKTDLDNNFINLLNEIYLSSLDVSFSHCGGIIACIDPKLVCELTTPNEYEYIINGSQETSFSLKKGIINYIDNLLPNNDIKDYEENRKKYPKTFDNEEMKKRFKKREFLLKITERSKFQMLDRKLRTELISMDGATIIDYEGNIISIGAIIQNDSGSYGGGRGAAAKKLSNYGFSIKISTDGYIEVYIKDRIKYNIK